MLWLLYFLSLTKIELKLLKNKTRLRLVINNTWENVISAVVKLRQRCLVTSVIKTISGGRSSKK